MFSRAILAQLARGHWLRISGTASVVGHATPHVGDGGAQVREIVANMHCVMAEANHLLGRDAFDLRELTCRVDVRHRGELPPIRETLARSVGGPFNVAFLRANICPDELLLEIGAGALSNTGTAGGGRR